jgi:nucleotide-binding universal stress UspA family protein
MSTQSTPHGATIVVGIDGSDGATRALGWAVAEAGMRTATLEVVHSWAPPVPISSIGARVNPIDSALYEREANATLEESVRAIATFDPDGAVCIESRLVRGYASTVLLDRLDDADLLVVGSRGRGGFAGLLLGSVSQRCVEQARRPVAVIRSEEPITGKGVVVGVDGSEGSWHALQWAFDEAALRGTLLSVVHAWPPPLVAQPVGVVVRHSSSVDYAAHGERLLHAMVDELAARGPQQPAGISLLPIEERPASALLECSRSADVLVVGSRGRGGFMGLLLGSVSQQCVHHATCAVVVVPSRGG